MTTATFPATTSMLAALQGERVRLGQWAFGAAVRLSDQNRPLALKLIIECMIVLRALVSLVRPAPQAQGAARRSPASARRAPAKRPHRLAERTVRVARPRSYPAAACRGIPASSEYVHAHGARGMPAPISGQESSASLQKSRFLCMVRLRG